MANSGRISPLSGNSPVIAEERINAGHVILMTRLDNRLSNSPPIYPSLPATYPTMTMAKSVIITSNIPLLNNKWLTNQPLVNESRDEATRTPDPYVPNVVRYQLRYIPILRVQR